MLNKKKISKLYELSLKYPKMSVANLLSISSLSTDDYKRIRENNMSISQYRNSRHDTVDETNILGGEDSLNSTQYHKNCRINTYPAHTSDGTVLRTPVDDKYVPWNVNWIKYSPKNFTALSVLNNIHADKDDIKLYSRLFNKIDSENKLDRNSYHGKYELDRNGYPLNPMGRTGMVGRGRLFRWGVNHAADTILTKINNNVIEFLAIKRKDNNKIAIPGGMRDANESISNTLIREIQEEALSAVTDLDNLKSIFKNGKEIYRGYVDDSRNTDNAWIETLVMHYHIEDPDHLKLLTKSTKAGSDAKSVFWLRIDASLKTGDFHADHFKFIKQAVKMLTKNRADIPNSFI